MSIDKKHDFYCPKTRRHYAKSLYPKMCRNCQKVFMNREQYISETTSISDREYAEGPEGTVFEYRNCECDNTLVCLLNDCRDKSIEGLKKRSKFQTAMEKLMSDGVKSSEARKMLFQSKFKKSS